MLAKKYIFLQVLISKK